MLRLRVTDRLTNMVYLIPTVTTVSAPDLATVVYDTHFSTAWHASGVSF